MTYYQTQPQTFFVPIHRYSSNVENFPDCESLLEHLQHEDNLHDALTGTPRFFYRGQPDRYQDRNYPPEDQANGLTKNAWRLESIISSDYRGAEALIADGETDIWQLGNIITHLRHHIIKAIITTHVADLNAADKAAYEKWANEQCARPRGTFSDGFGSVGQHCGFKTHYLDVSSDPAVALWFASYDFLSGTPINDGVGYVYRVDREILETISTELNNCPEKPRHGSETIRWVDIRQLPHCVARRPSGQRGFSLINFQAPTLLIELIERKGIIVYGFRRDDCNLLSGYTPQIVSTPATDPILKLFEEVKSGNWASVNSDVDLQAFCARKQIKASIWSDRL